MRIFKLLLLIGGMYLMAAPAYAQSSSKDMPADHQILAAIEKHTKGVTPDQETQLLTLIQDYLNQSNSLRQNSRGRADLTAQMNNLKVARENNMKTILTADQYKTYKIAAMRDQIGW